MSLRKARSRRETALLDTARQVPEGVRRTIELMRLCFLTPEEFHEGFRELLEWLVTDIWDGTARWKVDALHAVCELLRIGVAVTLDE